MGIFDQGQATQTAIPGALAPADIASRLFAIKLLLARLAQSGGAPQTLGEYIKSGPRKLDQGTISDASSGLMQALSQPGAFTKGPTVTKTKPSSPSLFQEGASGLSLLMMLNALTGGGKPEGLSIQDQLLARALGVDPTTLKQPTQTPSLLSRIFGGGDAATTGQLGGITIPDARTKRSDRHDYGPDVLDSGCRLLVG